MTSNQIEYLKYLESKRANKAQEALTQSRDTNTYNVSMLGAQETKRANLAREDWQRASLDETSRSNRANESLNRARNQETERSNRASESIRSVANSISQYVAEETERAHRASESINLFGAQEQRRANLAKEAENIRANNLSYAGTMAQVDLGYARDLTDQSRNAINLNLGMLNAREANRANLAREAETNRANIQREKEDRRHNKSVEAETAARNARDYIIRQQELREQTRHNKANEIAGYINSGSNALRSVAYTVDTASGILGKLPIKTQEREVPYYFPNELIPDTKSQEVPL